MPKIDIIKSNIQLCVQLVTIVKFNFLNRLTWVSLNTYSEHFISGVERMHNNMHCHKPACYPLCTHAISIVRKTWLILLMIRYIVLVIN